MIEYVSGGSLYTYLKTKASRQMAEVEAKYLFKQLVLAVDYCHQRSITHRDIKLENILLNDEKNKVKLIDFGFSTCIPNDRKVKLFCGTPSYMAPEIVSKQEYSGPPAEVWAMGVLYFALLCGKFPFKGQNDRELFRKICKYDLEFTPNVSLSAKSFLFRIMKKDPDQRLTAAAILSDHYMQGADRDYQAIILSTTTATISNLISTIRTTGQKGGPEEVKAPDSDKQRSTSILPGETRKSVKHAFSADRLKVFIRDQNR